MTWTFSDTSVSTALAQVRITIGDTLSTDPMLTDEIINMRLAQYSSDVRMTSIKLLRDLIAKYSRDVDRNQDGMTTNRSQKIQHWKDVLAELLSETAAVVSVFVGGVSGAANETTEDNSDNILPTFKKGQFDNE